MWRRPATRGRRDAELGEPVYISLLEEGDVSLVARTLTCFSVSVCKVEMPNNDGKLYIVILECYCEFGKLKWT